MDPSLQPILSAVRSLLIVAGTFLAAHGYAHGGEDLQLAAGAIMVVGPALWGVYSAISHYRTTHALAKIVSPGNPKQAIADAKASTQ